MEEKENENNQTKNTYSDKTQSQSENTTSANSAQNVSDRIEDDPTKFKVNLSVSENISGLLAFLKSTISFREGVKKRETIVNIKKDIVFQGHNVWILVCSMVVASIGLNMNSPAVVVGAMLISPLMGPILGVGLGVATVDLKLIYASLKNFGLMIAIALIASYLYFLVSPVKSVTPELFGRVKPTAFDIPIAFFGGLAGIIAASRGGAYNVVSGVAIATALMPPLCTTGYGLATGKWEFAAGAFYLFLLNCLFICLATIIVLRYLKFPQREFVHEKVEKKAKLYMYIIFGVIVVPAIWLSVSTIKESKFEANIEEFVNDVVLADDKMEVSFESYYEKNKLSITVLSDDVLITDAVEEQWQSQLETYDLGGVEFHVRKNDIGKQIEAKLKDAKLFDNGSNEGYKIINQKESEIAQLESKITKLTSEKDSLAKFDLNEKEIRRFISKSNPKLKGVSVFSNEKNILVLLNDTNSVDSLGKIVLLKELSAFVSGKGISNKKIQLK